MTGQEVNDMSEVISGIFKKNSRAVAFVVAPYLVSEKVAGYRGQLRPGWYHMLPQNYDMFGHNRPSWNYKIDTPDHDDMMVSYGLIIKVYWF